MTITLQGERPVSRNQMNKRLHWSHRAAEAQRVHTMVAGWLKQYESGGSIERFYDYPFSGTVNVTITAYFDTRPLDADNISPKYYLDSLKGTIVIDDSPAYVRSVTTRSMIDKTNPRVEITIQEVNDNE